MLPSAAERPIVHRRSSEPMKGHGGLHRPHQMRGRGPDPDLEQVKNTDHDTGPDIVTTDAYLAFSLFGMISRAIVST